MKLKLKCLKPNPYKKWIDDGKLNQEQIEVIKASLDDLGLMGSIPIVKRQEYHLISHHHRVEALKQKFGDEYDVDVTLHDYDDDQLFRGMIVENLTQKKGELQEESHNISATSKYLIKNKILLDKKGNVTNTDCSDSEQSVRNKKGQLIGSNPEYGSVRQINQWLNKHGEVMAIGKISELLLIAKNLDKELLAEVEKTHKGSADRRGEILSQTQAVYLSKFEDKDEQKKLAVALKTSTEQRVRAQGKLISVYKKSPKKVKEMVLNHDIDLCDVEQTKIKYEQSQEAIQMDDVIDPHEEFVDRMERKIEDIYIYNQTTLSSLSIIQLERAYNLLETLNQHITKELNSIKKIMEQRKLYEGI